MVTFGLNHPLEATRERVDHLANVVVPRLREIRTP
jgi:hypothetical protein